MVLLYMKTWIPSIYPLDVSIYTSTMDPMGKPILLSSWEWETWLLHEYVLGFGWCSFRSFWMSSSRHFALITVQWRYPP